MLLCSAVAALMGNNLCSNGRRPPPSSQQQLARRPLSPARERERAAEPDAGATVRNAAAPALTSAGTSSSSQSSTHLLRLWAELYRVRLPSRSERSAAAGRGAGAEADADDDEDAAGATRGWQRIVDDLVPVNLVLLAANDDDRDRLFQVLARNRLGRTLLDARIARPGTLNYEYTYSYTPAPKNNNFNLYSYAKRVG